MAMRLHLMKHQELVLVAIQIITVNVLQEDMLTNGVVLKIVILLVVHLVVLAVKVVDAENFLNKIFYSDIKYLSGI